MQEDKKEKTLSERYMDICNEYSVEFVRRYYHDGVDDIGYAHGIESWWVADKPEVFYVNDDWFNLRDIMYAIDNNIEEVTLVGWYDYCSDVWSLDDNIKTPTLEEWCNGCERISKDDLFNLRCLHNEINKAKADFEEELEKVKDKLKNKKR